MTFFESSSDGPATPDADDPTETNLAQAADPVGQEPSVGPTEEPNPAIRQLEGMLADLATYARPVLREIAARAAELAAKAADAAGPAAQKAADTTDQLGGRVASKGREIASDLRRASDSTPSDGDVPTERSNFS